MHPPQNEGGLDDPFRRALLVGSLGCCIEPNGGVWLASHRDPGRYYQNDQGNVQVL